MKKGHLFFDYSVRRFDIAFDKREFHDNEYHTYGGLHCGQTLQILTAEHGWTPTRIEYDSRYDDPAQDFYGDRGWYLVGMESITSLVRTDSPDPGIRYSQCKILRRESKKRN